MTRCRITDFRPYNSKFDPQRRYEHAMPAESMTHPTNNIHHAIPASASNAHRKPTSEQPTDCPKDISMKRNHPLPSLYHKAKHWQKNAPALRIPTALHMHIEGDTDVAPAPKTVTQARKSPSREHWKASYEQHLKMHEIFGTFEYVDRTTIPFGTLVPKPAFIFTHKRDKDGNIIGYTVRCSYRGDKLIPDLHFDAENIAVHSVDRTTMRLLFAVCAQMDLNMYHIDLTTAFLRERYQGTVLLYMEIPQHSNRTLRHPGKVSKVIKNIFGTPQAPKIYLEGLSTHLLHHGYKHMKSDTNLYVKHNGTNFIAVAITIDDFAAAKKDPELYKQLL